jgi:hypothetical protein
VLPPSSPAVAAIAAAAAAAAAAAKTAELNLAMYVCLTGNQNPYAGSKPQRTPSLLL